MKQKIFISYSHKDADQVMQFVQQLSLCGFDLWIDEKDVEPGNMFVTKICRGICESNVYMVFISCHSVGSCWVEYEIDYAVKRMTASGKLCVIPVILDDTPVPIPLDNLDYLDARFSIKEAAAQYVEKHQGAEKSAPNLACISIANIGFTISRRTNVEVGTLSGDFTPEDLEEDSRAIREEMRKKAYGILMNFVSMSDFDSSSAVPKFMNGIYSEKVQRIGGDMVNGIRERIIIDATVFHPDEYQVYRLLNERLEVLEINAITFGFAIPLIEGETLRDLGIKCLQKIQNDYIILSYDNTEGVMIEVADGFYLSFCVMEDIIKIKLSGKNSNPWMFEHKMKEFSVLDFLHNLLER